jgi:AraC-like DNA-binding protein
VVHDTLAGVTPPLTEPKSRSRGALTPSGEALGLPGPAGSPDHHCLLSRTPWAGVHGTRIHSGRHYGRHWHATLGIGWVEAGAQRSASGRGPVEAHAGDLISSNPGEVHDGHPIGDQPRRWQMLYFEPDVAAGWLNTHRPGDVDIGRPVFQDPPLRAALQRLFTRLAQWRESGAERAAALACEEALTIVTAGLGRHAGTALRMDPGDRMGGGPLAVVRERLADDLLNAPTLAELAMLAGCSRFQLLRRFQQAHGLPPHAWLLQQRLERARQLIRAGCGLAQAAADSGFADQSHLTRHFTRQFGYTPGAWRAATVAAPLQ